MGFYLGIDTSNYTTSVALFDSSTGTVRMERRLLPVKEGACGLRQSDAVFLHVKQLGALAAKLAGDLPCPVAAIGYSAYPRRQPGSYMPCFLVGDMVSELLAGFLGVARHAFSHQEGHIAAALYSAGRLDLLEGEPFYAFHVSGGTTECLLVTSENGAMQIDVVGKTLDLHAGQVIDRVGVMLGLPFPCGPELEQLALSCDEIVRAKAMIKGENCCLSGIENQCRKLCDDGTPRQYIAAFCLMSIHAAVSGVTKAVLQRYGERPVLYAGGVMANSLIRTKLEQEFGGMFAEPRYSADNSAGTAILAGRIDMQVLS